MADRPTPAKDKPTRGKVISVGDGRLMDDGKRSKLQVKVGQKGRQEILLTLHGKPAHAALPHAGRNPIEAAATALSHGIVSSSGTILAARNVAARPANRWLAGTPADAATRR